MVWTDRQQMSLCCTSETVEENDTNCAYTLIKLDSREWSIRWQRPSAEALDVLNLLNLHIY